MASDLSKLIQDVLCDTITNLLGKTATLQETTKVHIKDLENIQLLKVDATFEFENITSSWSFMLPAYSSSYIFNTMLGEDSEPVLEINDDIADAINEVISNVSGGLTMAITPDSFEDLGSVKFTINGNQTITDDDINNLDNIYKFTIDLEGTQIIVFILFDDVIMPFLEIINKSQMSLYPENNEIETNQDTDADVDIDTNTNQEVLENKKTIEEDKGEEKKELSNETIDTPLSNDKDSKEEKDSQINEEVTSQTEKDKKIKKIIMAIGGLLVLTIIAGIIMYFMGLFDPKPIKIADTNTTKTIKTKDKVEIVKYKTKKKINFKMSLIDEKRLNARLQILTKYNVLTKKEIKAQKTEQDERIKALAKEKKLIAFAKQNKEEPLAIKKEITQKETTKKEIIKNIITTKKSDSSQDIQKLNFVLVHSLKFRLYKDMILKTKTKQARISICKNENGRTAVYIGPFEEETSQKHMLKLMKEQSDIKASLANITAEEFNIRCNFE